MWDNFKCPNIHVIGIPERGGEKKITQEIMAEIFLSLMKTNNPQIH